MGYGGGEPSQEYRLLRAVDAAIALILVGELGTECGWRVIVRLLAAMIDASDFTSGDPASMLTAAHSALADRAPSLRKAAAEADEQAVRASLRGAFRAAAQEDFDVDYVDDLGHATAFMLGHVQGSPLGGGGSWAADSS